MDFKQKQLTVADAYKIMSICTDKLDEEGITDKTKQSVSTMSVLLESVIIGLLYLEYPNTVMEKIGPVIKSIVAKIAIGYNKEKGEITPISNLYAYLMRVSYRMGIFSARTLGSLSDEDKSKFAIEAVTKLMDIGRELADKPSKACASVCYGLFASSFKGLNGAVAYTEYGQQASEETMLKGIASQSAAGILAYKAFILDVAASDNVEVDSKTLKGISMDNIFDLTNGTAISNHVQQMISTYSMDALIDAADNFASLSLGIAESASFKTSRDFEADIQSRIDGYKKECGDDISALHKKLSEDSDVSKIANLVEKRFISYTSDSKTNAAKGSSIFSLAALDALAHSKSIVVTNN